MGTLKNLSQTVNKNSDSNTVDVASPTETQEQEHGRGASHADDFAPEHEAIATIDAFESVGACSFDLTFRRGEPGYSVKSYKGVSRAELLARLRPTLKECERAERDFIIRPRTHNEIRLVQLDDLDSKGVERIQPFALLVIRTSKTPTGRQAWVAIQGADDSNARRLRVGVKADRCASGATRIPGSRNFKPQYAPNYPHVRIEHAAAGRIVSVSELEQAGLLEPERPPRAPIPALRDSEGEDIPWPSYPMCLQSAGQAQDHDGPDRSRADFEYCRIASHRFVQRGLAIPVERIARELMMVSEKARERGNRYALKTTENAARIASS